MNQVQYKQVLEIRLLPQLRSWFPAGDCTFMQDGAPCRNAKSVKQFLSANKVKVLPWPGNSPDLNPIENLWEIVKWRISVMKPTTKTQLIQCVIKVWHRDPEIKEMCQKLICGMANRVKLVLKAKGKHTKY